MRKVKLRKNGFCFITGCLIKPFKIIIIFFIIITSSSAAQVLLFVIRMTQKISKGEIRNSRWLGMANCNIYFKNYFNRLVMNITEINFLY